MGVGGGAGSPEQRFRGGDSPALGEAGHLGVFSSGSWPVRENAWQRTHLSAREGKSRAQARSAMVKAARDHRRWAQTGSRAALASFFG